jgi:hypothetical protein
MLGLVLGLLIEPGWRLFRVLGEFRAESRRTYKDKDRRSRSPRGAKACAWSSLAYIVFLIGYGSFIGLAHDRDIVAQWIDLLQPAADWLGFFIPALRNLPVELIKAGRAAWAAPVQHVMFVDWILTLILMAWIAIGSLAIHKRASANPLDTWPLVTFVLIGVPCTAFMFSVLFFGWISTSSWRTGGLVGLPVLGLSFTVMVFLFFLSWIFCIALLHRLFSRDDGVARGQMKDLFRDAQGVARRIWD